MLEMIKRGWACSTRRMCENHEQHTHLHFLWHSASRLGLPFRLDSIQLSVGVRVRQVDEHVFTRTQPWRGMQRYSKGRKVTRASN